MKKVSMILIILFVFTGTRSLEAENTSIIYEKELFLDNTYYSLWDISKMNYSELSLDITGQGNFIQNKAQHLSLKDNSDGYFIGYMKELEEWMSLNEETINFIIEENDDREHKQGNYKVNFTSWKQVLEGIRFGRKIISNKKYGMNLILKGKLVRGLELIQNNYIGKIEKKNDNYYLSGFMDGINSNINGETKLHNEEFSSYGYSIGGNIIWYINKKIKLNLDVEDLYSNIDWRGVYTKVMKYDNSSIGLYSNESSTSSSFGNHSDEDYTTHLNPEYDLSLQTKRSKMGVFYRRHIYDQYIYDEELYPYFNYEIGVGSLQIKPGVYGEFYTLGLAYKGLEIDLKTKDLDVYSSSGVVGQVSLEMGF